MEIFLEKRNSINRKITTTKTVENDYMKKEMTERDMAGAAILW